MNGDFRDPDRGAILACYSGVVSGGYPALKSGARGAFEHAREAPSRAEAGFASRFFRLTGTAPPPKVALGGMHARVVVRRYGAASGDFTPIAAHETPTALSSVATKSGVTLVY